MVAAAAAAAASFYPAINLRKTGPKNTLHRSALSLPPSLAPPFHLCLPQPFPPLDQQLPYPNIHPPRLQLFSVRGPQAPALREPHSGLYPPALAGSCTQQDRHRALQVQPNGERLLRALFPVGVLKGGFHPSPRVGSSPPTPSKSSSFRKQGLSLRAPGPPLYSGCTSRTPLQPGWVPPELTDSSSLPSPSPSRLLRAPRGRPSKIGPCPEPASPAGSPLPLQRRPAWFLNLGRGGFRVARPSGAGPAPAPLRPRPPRLDWPHAPLPGLLPAPSVRGHRHLVQRVPRGDLEAPLGPGAHCGDEEGARAREEERRCRTELRQEQETYGRAGAATAARGHRGVPSSGLAAARRG